MPTPRCGFFRRAALALLTGLWANGCGTGEDLVAPAHGSLLVANQQSGAGADPDGIVVVLDGTDRRPLAADSTLLLSDLAIGQHRLAIEGLASDCTLDGPNPRVVTVIPDSTAQVVLAISCAAPSQRGTLVVTVSTRGIDLDPDGYAVVVDSLDPQPIQTDGEVAFPELSADSHAVRLGGIAGNCTLAGDNPRMFVVAPEDTAVTSWGVTCWPPPSGRIAFIRGALDAESRNVFVINADGTQLTALTNSDRDTDEEPTWSPDGARIAFTTFVTNDLSATRLRILRLTNGSIDTLPTGSLSPFNLRWSPDGSRLSFTDFAIDDDARDHVYLTNADGSGRPRRLARVGNEDAGAWAPDGRRLVFTGSPGSFGLGRLYLTDISGTAPRPLTPDSSVIVTEQGETEWSPDGSKIAFVGPHPFGEEFGTDIYVIGATGTGLLNLTHSPPFSSNRRPRWSPDGQRIAFLCSEVDPQGSVGDLCTVAADGSSLSNLTHALATYEDLGWSPDGTKIVFIGPDPSERLFGDNDLFVMNADGSGIVRLTHSPNFEQSPVWSR
jgi:Tol biopolymer transport system component